MTQEEIRAEILRLVKQYNEVEEAKPLEPNKYNEFEAQRIGLATLRRSKYYEDEDFNTLPPDHNPFRTGYWEDNPRISIVNPGTEGNAWYSSFC